MKILFVLVSLVLLWAAFGSVQRDKRHIVQRVIVNADSINFIIIARPIRKATPVATVRLKISNKNYKIYPKVGDTVVWNDKTLYRGRDRYFVLVQGRTIRERIHEHNH